MALVPICCKMSYNDQALHVPKLMIQNEKGIPNPFISIREGCRCNLSSISIDKGTMMRRTTHGWMKAKTRKHKSFTTFYASKSSTSEKQLKLLDSYFGKLQSGVNQKQDSSMSSSDSIIESKTEEHDMINFVDRSGQIKAKKELESLDDYLGKLKKGSNSRKCVQSSADEANQVTISNFDMELNSYMQLGNEDERGSESSQLAQPYDEISDLYLISILVSLNIAVFLFEMASPIRNSGIEYLSLPLMYGAKINHLILVGEWWRLLTPMFLHSGLLHVALSSWVLLTFGPQVCRGYGAFTFILIYILGGISGNIISFLHTPDPTVGGTGPVFAIIGAWLIYQIQNKEVNVKEASESLFQKAVIATAFCFLLSNFGPIDNWTHFGAACAGIVYGFITCPTLKLDDASSKSSQEGVALVRRYADPCKSVIAFAIFVLVLSSSLLFLEPPLNSLELNSFV